MKQKVVKLGSAHETFMADCVELLERHQGILPPEHLLAIAAKLVGRIMLIQDRRMLSHDDVMAIIIENIKIGNGDMMPPAPPKLII